MVKVMLQSRAGKRGLRVRFLRRNKYAASLLSEVTNTAKTRIQGSFRAFYMGEKRRKCNDLRAATLEEISVREITQPFRKIKTEINDLR